jgi:hypothetical protein
MLVRRSNSKLLVQKEMVVFRRRGITDPVQIKNPQMPRLRIPNTQMQRCLFDYESPNAKMPKSKHLNPGVKRTAAGLHMHL